MQPIILFSKKQLQGKYCLSPFIQLNVSSQGKVGICGCSVWQPTMVGNIFENTLSEILAGDTAKKIRQSIIDGTYQYCNEKTCGILYSQNLNSYETLSPEVKWAIEDNSRFLTPHHIVIGLDRTCNLWCPSCRHQVVKNSDEENERNQQLATLLSKNLFDQPTDKFIELTLDVSGEVFASPLLINFLNNVKSKDFPNLKIDIISNGILAPKRWHKLGEMQNHVHKITISYDAASKEIYEKLRRGGNWEDILVALEWLKNKKQENGMEFNTRMVVQKNNYQQMKNFYD
jgi:sulfatase maturation enzyme AslB (radical SAM superfamily)